MNAIASTRRLQFATPQLNCTAVIPNAAYLGVTVNVTRTGETSFEVEALDADLNGAVQFVGFNPEAGSWEIGRINECGAWLTDATGQPTERGTLCLAIEMAAERLAYPAA